MNRQTYPKLFCAALLTLLVAAPAVAEVEVRKIEKTLHPGTATRLHVDVTFGGLAIEGTDGRDVEVEVSVGCTREDIEKCRARAHQILLRPRVKKDKLVVKLKYTPRGRARGLKATMRLKVPRNLVLDVNVRSGGVRVEGMTSHVEIDTVAGDVELKYPFQRAGRVNVDIGFGRADLFLPEGQVKGSGFPKRIDWSGSGPAVIEVDIGTGDAAIHLE
ncbi:MAG: hypothetical protein V3T72_21175 [Thermoanaerobaculia bacterium]